MRGTICGYDYSCCQICAFGMIYFFSLLVVQMTTIIMQKFPYLCRCSSLPALMEILLALEQGIRPTATEFLSPPTRFWPFILYYIILFYFILQSLF